MSSVTAGRKLPLEEGYAEHSHSPSTIKLGKIDGSTVYPEGGGGGGRGA